MALWLDVVDVSICIIYNMGQNSTFHLSITDVIRDWVPIAKDSNIFINRNNRQHLQRFIVQVPLS